MKATFAICLLFITPIAAGEYGIPFFAYPFQVESLEARQDTGFVFGHFSFGLSGDELRYGVVAGPTQLEQDRYIGYPDYTLIQVWSERDWVTARELSARFCGFGQGFSHFVPVTDQLLSFGIGTPEAIREEIANMAISGNTVWMRVGIRLDVVLRDLSTSEQWLYSVPFLVVVDDHLQVYRLRTPAWAFMSEGQRKNTLLSVSTELEDSGSSDQIESIKMPNKPVQETPAKAAAPDL